jgi:hypothetical protein
MAALDENGITIPEGIEVIEVENNDKVFHVVLSAMPHGQEVVNLLPVRIGET